MKIDLAVFADRPLDLLQKMQFSVLLGRRKHHLRQAGCTVQLLEITNDLTHLANQCRACGADALWLTIADGGRGLRRQLFRQPALLEGLAVYADGIIGPDLPPTQGQLRQLTAMGITYLPQRPDQRVGERMLDLLSCSAGTTSN